MGQQALSLLFFTPAHGSRAVSKEQKLNLKNKCFDACDLSIQEGERLSGSEKNNPTQTTEQDELMGLVL